MQEPEYGTIEYFKIPGNWQEFVKRTGFVDTLELEMAKAQRDTTPLNDTLDIHKHEPSLRSGS